MDGYLRWIHGECSWLAWRFGAKYCFAFLGLFAGSLPILEGQKSVAVLWRFALGFGGLGDCL
jgi:hypothetical protein